ncbi:MAG: hypothetical protein BAJALOKI2v1_520029 [Promethearchaeota archaeon]|nr:MAG: hypothetical protein BAJALOKI2v1_520029 [Candidatus Lokiarchaeota archaeon]
MSFKLIMDENIPNSVIIRLRELNFEIISIREDYRGIDDEEIIELSKKYQRPIITMDKDFGYLAYRKGERPYGVILIRIHPQTPEYIFTIINHVLNQLKKQKINIKNKFIVSDGKTLRIRKI